MQYTEIKDGVEHLTGSPDPRTSAQSAARGAEKIAPKIKTFCLSLISF